MIVHTFETKSLLRHLIIISILATPNIADAAEGDDTWVFGVRLRVGGKYDDVRICGATPPGVPGGPDIDISFFTEVALGNNISLDINLPVMRPIMIGLSNMVQFEPEATLLFRSNDNNDTQVVFGPSLGVSLHYGPDYHSEHKDNNFGPYFFAMGPRIGGYIGLDFVRPGETFNFQLGIHPYVTPLIAIDDPEDHRGWVAGATLDGSFRFHSDP